MKLLVTGGAGFIGSNFILYWLKKNPEDSIVNLDKLTYADFDVSLPLSEVQGFNKEINRIANDNPQVYLLDVDLYSTPTVIGIDFLIPKNALGENVGYKKDH